MILSLHQLQGGLLGPVFYSSIYVPRLDRTFWNNDEQRINQKKQAFLYGQRINADADPRQNMRFALLEKLAIAKRFGIESHCRFASATSQTRNGWNRCATLFFLGRVTDTRYFHGCSYNPSTFREQCCWSWSFTSFRVLLDPAGVLMDGCGWLRAGTPLFRFP